MLSEHSVFNPDIVIHNSDFHPELCPAPELLPDTQWIVDMFEDENNPAMMAIPAEIRHWNIATRSKYYQMAPTSEIQALVVRKIYHAKNVNNKAYELAQKNSKLKNPEFNLNILQMMANADLHDAGRFPQAFYFQTFDDRKSFDHAQMSANMAEAADFPYDENNFHKELTLGPVAQHSQIDCIDDPNYHSLRDADKLIITEEYIADLKREIENATAQGKELSIYTLDQKAIDQFKEGKSIHNELAHQSKANRILQRIAWIHNFKYTVAKVDFIQSGSLNSLLDLLDKFTGGTNDEIKQIVNEWQTQVTQNPIFTESLQTP